MEDLERLKASVIKKGILLATKVAERVGRIKERYPSMAQYYDITLELDKERKKLLVFHGRSYPVGRNMPP